MPKTRKQSSSNQGVRKAPSPNSRRGRRRFLNQGVGNVSESSPSSSSSIGQQSPPNIIQEDSVNLHPTPVTRKRSVNVRFSPTPISPPAESPLSPAILEAIKEAVQLQMTNTMETANTKETAQGSQSLSMTQGGHNSQSPSQNDHNRRLFQGEQPQPLDRQLFQGEQPADLWIEKNQSQLPQPKGSSEQSLSDVLNTLLNQERPSQPTTGMSPSCDDVTFDLLVPEKLKLKILSGDYVELHALLYPYKQAQTIQLDADIEGQSSVKISSSPARLITSMEQWSKAMFILGSVYLPSKPQEIPGFLKYMDFVQNLMRKTSFSAGLQYDETFRRMRQVTPRPWESPLVLHYVQALSTGKQDNFRPFRGSKPGTQLPKPYYRKGFCNRFQDGQGKECGSSCIFLHKCSKCRGNHPATRCPSSKTGSTTSYQAPKANN